MNIKFDPKPVFFILFIFNKIEKQKFQKLKQWFSTARFWNIFET